MLISLCNLSDEPPTNSNEDINLGSSASNPLEYAARGIGKAFEKLPFNKLNAGMSFIVCVLIIVLIFVYQTIQSKPDDLIPILIIVLIFVGILVIPFIIIEFLKINKKR